MDGNNKLSDKEVKRIKENFCKFCEIRKIENDWIPWITDVLTTKPINDVISRSTCIPHVSGLFHNFTEPWDSISTLMLFDNPIGGLYDKYPMVVKNPNEKVKDWVSNFHKIMLRTFYSGQIDDDSLKIFYDGKYLTDNGVSLQNINFIDVAAYNVNKSKELKETCQSLYIDLLLEMLFYKTNLEAGDFNVIIFSNTFNKQEFAQLEAIFEDANTNSIESGEGYSYSIQMFPEVTANIPHTKFKDLYLPSSRSFIEGSISDTMKEIWELKSEYVYY